MNDTQDKKNKAAIIRDLNDQIRNSDATVPGTIVVTSGVQTLLREHCTSNFADLMNAVRKFDDFSTDNDPHQEHDFGALDFEGCRIFWKLDYYAPDMMHGSEDPSDPDKTVRVLTIMLAEEY